MVALGERKAATTRWCSARWCATTRIFTIRSDSCPAASKSIFRSRRTRICTARASSRTSRTRIRLRRSSPGFAATTAVRAITRTISCACSVFRSSRRGTIGSRSSMNSSAVISRSCTSIRSHPIERSRVMRWVRSRGCTSTRRLQRSTRRFAIRDSSST